ncbi:MAG: aldehyde dehydrogenase family protein, partial [Actinomycetota bacterium]
DIAQRVSSQNGMPIAISSAFEGVFPANLLRYYAGVARTLSADEARTGLFGGAITVRREPIGVVGAIVPWNFPQSLAAFKYAPALAAGCTLVIKPSPETCLDIGLVADAAVEAGIPNGVINIVPGGREVGAYLVSHPRVDKISFTGSTAAGRSIAETCGRLLRPVTLELGGKSAAIVLDDVQLDYAVDGALWGVFFHNGQVCSAGTRLLVQRSIHDDFLAELVKRADALKVGPALDPASDEGPIVSQTQLETVERYVALGREEGADVLAGGERAIVEGHDGGYYYRPTIFGGVDNSMRIAQEEIFGPVLVVISFQDDDQAVRLANDSIYGLAGGIWSGDNGRAVRMAEQIRTGTLWINDYHMINPRFPFGGYKQSGIGREHGEIGFNEYREIKHIHVDLGGPVRARHPWWDLTVPKREDPNPPGPEAPGSKPTG